MRKWLCHPDVVQINLSQWQAGGGKIREFLGRRLCSEPVTIIFYLTKCIDVPFLSPLCSSNFLWEGFGKGAIIGSAISIKKALNSYAMGLLRSLFQLSIKPQVIISGFIVILLLILFFECLLKKTLRHVLWLRADMGFVIFLYTPTHCIPAQKYG